MKDVTDEYAKKRLVFGYKLATTEQLMRLTETGCAPRYSTPAWRQSSSEPRVDVCFVVERVKRVKEEMQSRQLD